VRIKICGITRPEDAELALRLGADTIGCVFHAGSARVVSDQAAREIRSAVGDSSTMVGLFVDPEASAVEALLDRVEVDVLQFHGNEPPEFCEQFARPYLKAVAMTAEVDLAAMDQAYGSGLGLVLDSAHGGQFGGSGQRFDWDWVGQGLGRRAMLAGGLTAENVAEAIARVQPAAVDVSSGVEKEKGVKDEGRMRAFIEAAQAAMTDDEL
jgi:phosphoribosylanthranilate isomerase